MSFIITKKYESKSPEIGSNSTRRIYDMYIDKEGIIWFVSKLRNLNKFDTSTKLGETYKFDNLSSDFNYFQFMRINKTGSGLEEIPEDYCALINRVRLIKFTG